MSTDLQNIRCDVDGKQFSFSFEPDSNYIQVKIALCQFIKTICSAEEVSVAAYTKSQEEKKSCDECEVIVAEQVEV